MRSKLHGNLRDEFDAAWFLEFDMLGYLYQFLGYVCEDRSVSKCEYEYFWIREVDILTGNESHRHWFPLDYENLLIFDEVGV